MTAPDVFEFVLASCPGRPTGSAKLVVTVTRSVLDWLHLTGLVEVSLAAAVPAVAGWKLAGLPQALTTAQLRALLGSCDRRTPTGRRDYVIVLLLARLGLRSGEVARLGLDDINWHTGEPGSSGRGTAARACRFRPMSARRSRPACDADALRRRRVAASSSASTHHTAR